MKEPESKATVNRRELLVGASTLAAAALGMPNIAEASQSAQSTQERPVRKGPADKPPYNIVFIIVDQQTHQLLGGPEYKLQGTDRIARNGV
ncbi:MAG TPA: hypothetical protein VN936_09940, partial [Candidatus Acidoferrum sp.]|nr:hypothetical protein [Candidatus Acidoferrum sp.]